MNLIPKHIWILPVLRLSGKQLHCGVKKKEPIRIDIQYLAGIGVSDEVWMDSDVACPPLAKVVSVEPERDKAEHSLEPNAVERNFDCIVLYSGMAINDSDIFSVTENRLAKSRPSAMSTHELREYLLPRH